MINEIFEHDKKTLYIFMFFLTFHVQHVGWWSPTIIRGEDREAIHIPNHKFTMNVVRNMTQKTHWRIKTHLAISHLDVNKINVSITSLFPFIFC